MLKNLLSIILFSIMLAACWFIFSGREEYFYLLFALFSITIVNLISIKLGIFSENIWLKYINFRLPLYLVWLFWEICKSSLEVSFLILQRKSDIDPKFVWIKSKQDDPIAVATYANSITLTPGTVSVIVDPDKIYVHSLTEEARDSLMSGTMSKKIFNIKKR